MRHPDATDQGSESPMTAPRISFEFFPPKSLEASFKLWETLGVLAPLAPEFVSVTYGAGRHHARADP